MKLCAADIAPFLRRFNGFNDAVVRRWQISVAEGVGTFEMDIETQDSQAAKGGWSLVTLRALSCQSLSFTRSSKVEFDVLSNGLHLMTEGDVVGAEFGEFADAPTSIEELKSSRVHVTSLDVSWSAVSIT
jgi:hypothetical protein